MAAEDSSTDTVGKVSKQEAVMPDGVSIETGTSGKDESDLLLSGEVDALFHAIEPQAYVDGDDFYSYGIENNRKTLEALFRYSYEQGLASKELTIEELFAASSIKFKG